jgi:hypothetical protein
MKKLTMIALSAALLAGASVAYAQNAPTTKHVDSPANINEGSPAAHTSGSQSEASATNMRAQIIGKSKYCTETSSKGKLDCRFASMNTCKSHNKANNFECVLNPKFGTTGAK